MNGIASLRVAALKVEQIARFQADPGPAKPDARRRQRPQTRRQRGGPRSLLRSLMPSAASPAVGLHRQAREAAARKP